MKEMYGVVLLYTEGMAICEDDWENLWCAEMPEEFVTAGDGIEIDGLTPFETERGKENGRTSDHHLEHRRNEAAPTREQRSSGSARSSDPIQRR